MRYVRFTERNDWEGETWHFYIPVTPNSKEIESLRRALAARYDYEDEDRATPPYRLGTKKYEESEVDLLVEEDSNDGYLPKHNKLAGRFELPSSLPASLDEFEELFYKGGIMLMMSKPKAKGRSA